MIRSSQSFAAIVFLLFWCSIILRYETFVFPNVSSITSAWLPFTTEDVFTALNNETVDDCIFRNSSLYRKVYVYPSPGEPEWQGMILSNESKNNPDFPRYPWDRIVAVIRNEAREQYHPHSMTAQFTTELIVHDLLRNSCLRTRDPEQADLFLVPYLPSVEFHAGVRGKPPSHATSPYAQAILDILDSPKEGGALYKKYEKWEKQFGLTSEYWKRRGGADHLLIFSEPLQGLTHPKGKRGSFHFIHTQRQLDPPIVLSVEVSTSFVQKYPACARKNILLPYPVTDGNQFNGELDRIAAEVLRNHSLSMESDPASNPSNQTNTAALPNELMLPAGRPFAYWLKAGIHGACVPLRQAMNRDYKHCSLSFLPLRQQLQQPYWIAMRLATFCPCPGGDTASAKRMFDAVLAGCIPVILSHDFVWPFSTEILPKDNGWRLDPDEFSLRWNASEYEYEHYNASSCHGYGLEERLKEISAEEISSLRRGMQRAARMFRYWEASDELPFNVLHHGVPANGGAVEALVKQLEERATGKLWPACREELERLRRENALSDDPTEFTC